MAMISDHIYDDIPPQMKNLNIVIPILMYFLTINIENALFFTKCKHHERHDVNQSQATLLMTLDFWRYIAEYTVVNFRHYKTRPLLRRRVTFSRQ